MNNYFQDHYKIIGKMGNRIKLIQFLLLVILSTCFTQFGHARDIPYRSSVSLKVGQSTVLKGVRDRKCGPRAPSWNQVKRKLPRSKIGKFSNGGVGTVDSDFCKGKVAARGVRFTATKAGKQTLSVYGDRTKISVK